MEIVVQKKRWQLTRETWGRQSVYHLWHHCYYLPLPERADETCTRCSECRQLVPQYFKDLYDDLSDLQKVAR